MVVGRFAGAYTRDIGRHRWSRSLARSNCDSDDALDPKGARRQAANSENRQSREDMGEVQKEGSGRMERGALAALRLDG